MNGRYPVDLNDYNEDVHNYLLNRGSTEHKGRTSSFTTVKKFIPTCFPGCKPTHFGATIRVFFPSEDEALLFSLAFGHLITASYVKQIDKLIKESI